MTKMASQSRDTVGKLCNLKVKENERYGSKIYYVGNSGLRTTVDEMKDLWGSSTV